MPTDEQVARLLVEGDTCWRLARADRAAVLIDGEAYFDALDAALERAQRSVRILGWDLHGGIRLRRPEAQRPDDEPIPTLLERLDGLVRQRRDLEIWVLEWDFALLYALERQFLPALRFGFATHRRLHFELDGEHPIGASHHEKLVVIDDRIAFCGGFDLAACRWDTRAHRAGDPRRSDPGAPDYRAFHDAMLLVDGDAAVALGELARRRWHRATGRRLDERRDEGDPWPRGVEPRFRDVEVGIARTRPGGEDEAPRLEVEALYLASLRAAERWIYIENQYLTAHAVGAVLAERLAEPDGPELVIVSTRICEGWLEELVPDGAIFDPERPVPPDELLGQLLPDSPGPERLRRALPWLFGVVAIAALAAAWRWTPLSEWTAPERLAALAAPLRTHAAGPWLAAGAIALAGSALVPITAMTVGAALVFGPLVGFAVALAGALASAALGFGLGRLLWGNAVRRLTGRHFARIRAALARDGMLAVAAVRLIPVVPFTIINIAAGASSIGFRDYALGTALAMTPGTLVLTVVTDRARHLLDEPGFGAALVVVGIAAGGALALRIARRRLAGDAH